MRIAIHTKTVKLVAIAVLQSIGPSAGCALVKKEAMKLARAILNAKITCSAGTLHPRIVVLIRKNA